MNIVVRSNLENYTVTLNAAGEVALYRSGLLLAEGPITPVDPEAPVDPTPVWHEFSMMASGSTLIVAVDGLVQLSYEDVPSLTAGLTGFSTGAANTGQGISASFTGYSAVLLISPMLVHIGFLAAAVLSGFFGLKKLGGGSGD